MSNYLTPDGGDMVPLTVDLVTQAAAIHRFWFDEVGPEGWWSGARELDAVIRSRFAEVWCAWRAWPPTVFVGDEAVALAAIILFDQLPRNMFRGSAEAFATDALARLIAMALVRRAEECLTIEERTFLYMPFAHSENEEDQRRSVALFRRLGSKEALEQALLHQDMIRRFGRFPGRNRALGRSDRRGEAEAARQTANW